MQINCRKKDIFVKKNAKHLQISKKNRNFVRFFVKM